MFMTYRNTTSYFTEKDLDKLHLAIVAFVEAFNGTIGSYMRSDGNTIKMHHLAHVTESIRRLGAPRHYNANPFEAHHASTKQAYQ